MTNAPSKRRVNLSEEACLDKAGKILSKRLHSTFELKKKLLSSGFPITIVNNAIAKLQSLDFLNDARFAEAYAQELMEKGFGPKKIFIQLIKRGIPKEIVSDQTANFANAQINETSQIDKNSAIKIAIQKKLRLLSRESDIRKKKEKLFRYLLSKGFLPEQIRAEIDNLNDI